MSSSDQRLRDLYDIDSPSPLGPIRQRLIDHIEAAEKSNEPPRPPGSSAISPVWIRRVLPIVLVAGLALAAWLLMRGSGEDEQSSAVTESSQMALLPASSSTIATTIPDGDATSTQLIEVAPSTFRLQMSDGREFAVYRFVIDGTEQVGIVIDAPATCWIIQYGAGDADVDGECGLEFIGGDPSPARLLLGGDDRRVLALRSLEMVLITDLLAVQSAPTNLQAETFTVVVVEGGSAVIDGERLEVPPAG